VPKTVRGVAYFFFRRFAVFFGAFFAAAFVLRFFAIAALLSLSGWRHRFSAVANRHALTSDYYKRKKIIVTPLNFVCSAPAPAPATVACRARRQNCAQKNAAPMLSPKLNSQQRGNTDGLRVSCASRFWFLVGARGRAARIAAISARAGAST
jgi:hypothetical protein